MLLRGLVRTNRLLTARKPNLPLSRKLLPQVHEAFGGDLQAMLTGGAFMEPALSGIFLRISAFPIANASNSPKAALRTVNDFKPFAPTR